MPNAMAAADDPQHNRKPGLSTMRGSGLLAMFCGRIGLDSTRMLRSNQEYIRHRGQCIALGAHNVRTRTSKTLPSKSVEQTSRGTYKPMHHP